MLSRVVTFFLVALLFSCSKSFVKTQSISDFKALQTKINKQQTFLENNNIKLKFKAVANISGKQNKLVGRAFLYSDTSLFISILSYSLGIEVLQLYFNSDSIYYVNKIGKEFFSGTYSDFKTYPNFGMVYSIFSSSYYNSKNTLISNNNCHYIADYKKFIVNDKYDINEKSGFFITTHFNSFGQVEKIDYKSYNGNYLRVNYSNFAAEYNFPTEFVIFTKVNKSEVEVKMNIENVDLLNKNHSVHSIPNYPNYKKIDIKDVEI